MTTDIDECGTSDDKCDPPATCHNTEGSYTCECPENYFLLNDGLTCLGNNTSLTVH